MTPADRAARLIRWYPKSWRARYGEEFAELLIADITERPDSVARTLDVARGGIVARLTGAGLTGYPAATTRHVTARHVTASLVSLGCAQAVFLGFGAAMWSQLTIGWQWSDSAAVPARDATVATSVLMVALLAVAAAAAFPVLAAITARLPRDKGLRVPSLIFAAAVTILVAGARHFENGWPGTGGHHGLVPGGLAAFGWAMSLSVSSYWAHPGALATFPAPELAWMAASPLVFVVAVASAVSCVRRVALPPKVLRVETRLAAAACVIMATFLAACCCWVATGGAARGAADGPPGLFHAGLIDVAGLAVLALALGTAQQAARTAVTRRKLAGS
jgi:hypothetical protein